MASPGLEVAPHVFTGVFAVILSAIALGLVYSNTNVKLVRSIRILSIVIAVLVWLTWLFVAPVYTQEYPIDKKMILKYPDTAVAHEFGMEVKEHIYYTGLILASLLPISAYTLDFNKIYSKKLLLAILVTLIIGGVIMEALGGWISVAAKQAWYKSTGGV
jgi:hypothetical protein